MTSSGRPQMSADRREQVRAFRLLGVIALVVLVAGIGLWLLIRAMTNDPVEQKTSPSSVDVSGTTSLPAAPIPAVQAPKPIDPHEQRLADLREKAKALDWSLGVELETAKELSKEAMEMSTQRFPDPDERQWLMNKMDAQ